MSSYPSFRKSKGFSLIELMISMVLGLVIVAGSISVFISTKNSARTQQGLMNMHSNGRAAVGVLANQIMKAGYPQHAGIDPFLMEYSLEGGNAGLDEVAIQYQSPVTCSGATNNNADGIVRTIFKLEDTEFDADNKPDSLVCINVVKTEEIDPLTGAVSDNFTEEASQVLVYGVENFQVLYGQDTVEDGVSNATRYVIADNVTDWSKIVSVRIALLANSQIEMMSELDDDKWNLMDQWSQDKVVPANDKMRRRPFISTIKIRNARG